MSSEHSKSVVKYFDGTHDAFERWSGFNGAIHFGYHPDPKNPLGHFESLDELTRRIIRLMNILPHQKVLDAGCGLGNFLISIGEIDNVGVCGINISRKQISVARERVVGRGLINVLISEQDFSETAFANEAFDKAVMCESFFHAEDKAKVLSEMSRVIKAGGKIVLADYFLKRKLSPPDRNRLLVLEKGWAGKVISIAEMEDLLGQNFATVNCFDVTVNVLPSILEAAFSASQHKGDKRASTVRKDHRRATIVLKELMANGTLGYFFITADKR